MVNEQTLRGNWNEIKGRIKSKWGQLTGDELQSFDGDVDKLVGLIQRKTGEARKSVEEFLEEAAANGASTISRATQAAGHYAQQAAESIQATTRQAAESVQHGYEEAEEMVRRRPTESVAICFGAGILTGLLVGLLIRTR